jgi:hypothetical protein
MPLRTFASLCCNLGFPLRDGKHGNTKSESAPNEQVRDAMLKNSQNLMTIHDHVEQFSS